MKTFFTTAAFLLAIGIIYGAGAQNRTVRVSEADCARFVAHVSSADVAYKPGVDADGNRVVPADLGGGINIAAPKNFEIPITQDLQKLLGIPVNPNQFQTQNFTIGVIKWENGRATFNGTPLQNEEAAKLSAICQKRVATRN
ncbi:MAG: hypothetical protein ACI9MJ_000843 [Alphaproteobacteria bacterium]|jgi:hypothetical protein